MPKAFIHEDFLLESKAARRLYHSYAAQQPILDFHSHLSPQDIAENRTFANLSDVWLAHDHYKWRAMRAIPIAGALASEALWTMKISHDRKKEEEARAALEACHSQCR